VQAWMQRAARSNARVTSKAATGHERERRKAPRFALSSYISSMLAVLSLTYDRSRNSGLIGG
jgi:hypothetical protein